MKIDSKQILLDPSDGALKAQERKRLAQSAPGKDVNEKNRDEKLSVERTPDSVSIRDTGRRSESANYTMSEIKNRADEVIKRLEEGGVAPPTGAESSVQSMAEERGELDRQERIEIARLRVNAGFYDRPEVIDELARRISENV